MLAKTMKNIQGTQKGSLLIKMIIAHPEQVAVELQMLTRTMNSIQGTQRESLLRKMIIAHPEKVAAEPQTLITTRMAQIPRQQEEELRVIRSSQSLQVLEKTILVEKLPVAIILKHPQLQKPSQEPKLLAVNQQESLEVRVKTNQMIR